MAKEAPGLLMRATELGTKVSEKNYKIDVCSENYDSDSSGNYSENDEVNMLERVRQKYGNNGVLEGLPDDDYSTKDHKITPSASKTSFSINHDNFQGEDLRINGTEQVEGRKGLLNDVGKVFSNPSSDHVQSKPIQNTEKKAP